MQFALWDAIPWILAVLVFAKTCAAIWVAVRLHGSQLLSDRTLVVGAALSGVYTIALIIIGEQFKGADLAAASALFGVMWGAGTVLGPQLGGLSYDQFPPHGIPLSLGVLTLMFLPFPLTAWLGRIAASRGSLE